MNVTFDKVCQPYVVKNHQIASDFLIILTTKMPGMCNLMKR